jgi:hypothetical protein
MLVVSLLGLVRSPRVSAFKLASRHKKRSWKYPPMRNFIAPRRMVSCVLHVVFHVGFHAFPVYLKFDDAYSRLVPSISIGILMLIL